MRIISGKFKGKRLFSLKGVKIRPTADRIRENIFNILAPRIPDSVVLDLFAGTGALGIEALSRGASFAIFMDSDKDALSVIEKNIAACKLQGRIKIIRADITKNNIALNNGVPSVNLVFMDPPYNKNLIKPALINLSASRLLQKNALIIIEHALTETLPEDVLEYKISDQRRYGKTIVSFLNYMV
ncbi:MAG: 16S rRNA (guanine(966)-N(2))-methyltransferase RsmD [Proteobacteria bacterium]|nr:16S rRNA (guanine(966)-N(2))-methyltransferase RsmD [Pseudomonadota bacterium]MBU1570507.1 16S rRNA (guanine(966)-N(2))-methyltransferase RsmD [Pseudomonadota bacterium]